MPETVILTWSEIMLASNAGVMRRINAVRNARAEPYGERPTAFWNHDINGCLAELAVAKHFGIYWTGTVGRVDLPDVGPLQVRSKTAEDERLVILPSDDDGQAFVSVLVALPCCRLDGWFRAGEAKRDDWNLPERISGRVRYFVPNAVLNPIATAHMLVAA